MNTRLLITAAFLSFLVLVPATIPAQDLVVDYLEGSLEYSSGGRSGTLSVDDIIPVDATLVLSSDSRGSGFAELGYDGATITLTNEGTYSTGELTGSISANNNLRGLFSNFQFLRKGRRNNDTVAATRATRYTDKPWFMTDSDAAMAEEDIVFVTDFYWDGMDRLDAGDLDGAAMSFYNGIKNEIDDETRSECSYRLGVVSQMAGEIRYARNQFLDPRSVPRTGYFYYDEYVVTVSAMHIDAREYDEARNLLDPYLAGNPEGEIADAAVYLYGLLD